jgi:hypothetical protein
MKSLLMAPLCLLILICKICISCSDKKSGCSRFKTGKYVFHNAFTGTDILIKRTDTLQTNIDAATGMGTKCKIQWTGDCKYKLEFLAFIINGRDSVFENYKHSTGTTDILKTAKNYYISETTLDGVQDVHRDTIWLSAE